MIDEAMHPVCFSEELLWEQECNLACDVPFLDCSPNLFIIARITGNLNTPALRRALHEVVKRHDALRSRYERIGGKLTRIVAPAADWRLCEVDYRCAARRRLNPSIERIVTKRINARFNLRTGPLFRATLFRLTDTRHVICLVAHHIVFDIWSRRVLARELSHIYNALSEGRSHGLGDLPAAYSDYVIAQRDRLQSDHFAKLSETWRSRTVHATARPWPSREAARNAASVERSIRFVLPCDVTSKLRAFSRDLGVTLASTMLTIFATAVSRGSAGEVPIGIPVIDRRRKRFENLVGLFVNVIVAWIAAGDRRSIAQMVPLVHAQVRQAFEWQDLPYGWMVRNHPASLMPTRVLFNYEQAIDGSSLELSGLRVRDMRLSARRRSFADVSIHVLEDAGVLRCHLLTRHCGSEEAVALAWSVRDMASDIALMNIDMGSHECRSINHAGANV